MLVLDESSHVGLIGFSELVNRITLTLLDVPLYFVPTHTIVVPL